MNKKLFVAIILLTCVLVGAEIVKELANIHIRILGSNATVEKVVFDFDGLVSGEEFSDSKNTTMVIKNVKNPYVVVSADGVQHPEAFESLVLYIDVQGHSGEIDLKSGGEFAVSGLVGEEIPVKLDLLGKVATVESDVEEYVDVYVSVGSGSVTVSGTISGTIIGG